jgi:glycosyltransferase involved in cell wall biosynthesis
LLAAGYALVLSSHWEGMPNVILEAMAAGLPVAATRVEGTAELVIDGRTGFLVTPQSPKALATALDSLLADPPRATAMGHAGQDLAAANFTCNQVLVQYDGLYGLLLGKSAST